jgi:hypothetical protein
MSAPAPGTRPSFTATGYVDGLGTRTLVFDREAGGMRDAGGLIERLTLRAEFGAFERALRDRAAQLAAWDGEGLARPKRVHRESRHSPLCVDSEIPAGHRLEDVLDAAAQGQSDQPLAGVDVALGLLLEVLPTLDRLHRKGRIVHGAIAPGRLLLTPSGHIVLVDGLYGDALERIAWPSDRLWRELGIAAPLNPSSARPGRMGDVSQAGVAALMMLLGRSFGAHEGPDTLPTAVQEAREIAELHGGAAFADGLHGILERLLPGPTPPFADAPDALKAVRGLVASAMGPEACALALATVADAMANLSVPQMPGLPASAEMPREPDVPAAPPAMELAHTPPALDLQIDVPAEAPVPARVPHAETTVEPEPPVLVAAPAPRAADTSPPRNKRGRRRKDPLRSNTAEATPPPSPTEPSAPAPVAATPAPTTPALPIAPPARPPLVAVRPAPQPSFPQPVFPQAGATGSEAVPISPYQDGAGRGRELPAVVPATPSRIAFQQAGAPIAVKGAPIAVKGASTGVKEPARPKKERVAPNPYDTPPVMHAPPPPAHRASSRWKLVAASAVVLLAGLAAGRAYLPAVPEARVPASRGAAPAPPATAAPASGKLELSTTPAGARVLLDGQPAGETPVTLDGVSPGRRTLTFIASGGSVTRTIRVVAGETTTLDVPVYSGWLAVDAPIVLQVAQDGRVIGDTKSRLMMPPGRHTVTLTNSDLGYQATEVVDIPAGEERRLRVVPSTMVNLNAVPWAEVWVDGTRVGETPIAGVSIPLGTRDIVFRHPQFGERKLTPTIRAGDPAAITVDFTRPGQS